MDHEQEELYANTSERNPRHLVEDVVEENADEFIPYEPYYAGADEYPAGRPDEHPTASTALVPYSQKEVIPYDCNMAVVPGRCVRGVLDVSSFIICIFLVIVQLGLIDYYYLTVLTDKVWYAWLGADSIVIVVLLWLLILAVRNNQTHMEEVCSVDAKVKYAWIGWLLYSVVLVAKVVVIFQLFYQELPPEPMDNNDKLFDDHLFKLGLSLSVVIFLFHLEAHHYTSLSSSRQLYITYLATAICLDLIDSIYFLDLLWQSFAAKWNLELWLDITILALAGFNFILPTFALIRLRFGRLPRAFLVSDKIWSFLYVILVNGPYLGIRIYLYILLKIENKGKHYDASLFAVKNVTMVYLALRELWTRLQYWRQKRNQNSGSHGQLTAPVNDEEN